MKIAFVGTCQVTGMAEAAAKLLPAATVTSHSPVADHEHATIAETVRGSDFVITQKNGQTGPLLSAEALSGTVGKVIFMPPVVFTGFHPDMFYLVVDGVTIEGGLGPYHSQIALAAYLLGLSPARSVALYNAHVFAEFGHFDAFDQAYDMMITTFQRHGYNLRPVLRRLINKRHTFMHTINHPTIQLLERLTVVALQRLGLVADKVRPLRDLPDGLARGIVGPVYPAIARRIGVDARDCYLRPADWTPAGEARDMSLQSHVEAAFVQYGRLDHAKLRTPTMAPIVDRLAALLA